MGPLVACLALAVGGCRAHRAEPFDPFGQAGVDGRPGAEIPLDGAFRNAAGAAVTLRTLADGKPLVIAPVQHHCPNLCGATLEGLRAAIAGQSFRPGHDVEVVALGIDPREGPAEAQTSRHRLGPGPGIAALVGAAPQIASVTHALGYRFAWDPRLGQYAHIAAVAVVTPDGRLTRWLYGVAPAPEALQAAVAEARRRQVGGLADRIRLLCYHYDPAIGRYSASVMTAVRVVGLLTLALLLAAIARLVVRERAGRRIG